MPTFSKINSFGMMKKLALVWKRWLKVVLEKIAEVVKYAASPRLRL